MMQRKIIISTKPVFAGDDLTLRLTSFGFDMYHFPTIEICKAPLSDLETNSLKHIPQNSSIIFTSKNGVNYFFEALKNLNHNIPIPTSTKLFAVGLQTENEIAKHTTNRIFTSPGKNAEDLIEYVEKHHVFSKTETVIFPTGNLANDKIESYFAGKCTFKRLTVYETRRTKVLDQKTYSLIKENRHDLIIFTSPSAVDNFIETFKTDISTIDIKAACIGQTTASQVIKHGYTPLLISSNPDSTTFSNEIFDLFSKEKQW